MTVGLLGVAVLLTGGAGVYTLRAAGDGCPDRDKLAAPVTEWRQEARFYTTVTLTNPNDCYGFRDEPVDITLFGPDGRRAISYFEHAAGTGPVHGDVGICCRVTLPPHGTWTIRFGSRDNDQGSSQLRVCQVRVSMMRYVGSRVWVRMPAGGDVLGHGSFPPGWKDTATKPLPDDPSWREPCATNSPGSSLDP